MSTVEKPSPLRLGAHPSNRSLHHYATATDLHAELADGGTELDVFAYNSGNQTIPLLTVGALDVVGTGCTPPTLALSLGLDVVAFAGSTPRSEMGGILVRGDSPITELGHLRGRTIAVMPTSWHPHYLAAALRSVDLTLRDVTWVELNTPTARDALLRGGVDAWIATGPDAQALLEGTEPAVRVVAGVQPHLSNRSVLWCTRTVARERRDDLLALLTSLACSDRRSGLPQRWWSMDAAFVAEQADGARMLHAAGYLPELPDVAAAVLELPEIQELEELETHEELVGGVL